jgi:hypothetical protein
LETKRKIAVIEIGDDGANYHIPGIDYYFYPDNVSEWELAEEIRSLVDFYDELVWPIVGPPHIRLNKVKEWVYNDRL